MSEVWISLAISGILAITELAGTFSAKWTIAKRYADDAAIKAMAKAAVEFDRAGIPPDLDVDVAFHRAIKIAGNRKRGEALRITLSGVTPGPELCFLAMTIEAGLFLALNYLDLPSKEYISPLLADSKNALPIVFGVFLATLIVWWATTAWRESILMQVQIRMRKLSMFFITALGCAAVAACSYLFIAQR